MTGSLVPQEELVFSSATFLGPVNPGRSRCDYYAILSLVELSTSWGFLKHILRCVWSMQE